MSLTLYDEEAALAYEPDPALPVDVLGVGFGELIASPDPVPTVEATWQLRGRAGTFTSVQSMTGNWQRAMDALIRLTVYDVERVYASLGGWPEPTPLDAGPVAPGGGIGAE